MTLNAHFALKSVSGSATNELAFLAFGKKLFANLKNYLYTVSDNKKLSYCWETVRRESMPRIAEMDVEMTI